MPTRARRRTKDMNEAAFLILSEAVGGRPATSDQTAARGAAAALLGQRGGKQGPAGEAKPRRPAPTKTRRPGKR
jgi:hypothetical protein